jgi:eukaryotic-like serine/threonine-protein kinase
MIGSRLSHYTISAPLGAGGMGVVYRAFDAHLNRTVALKVIAQDVVADPQRKQRFVREARAASSLSHPNIVTIHDIGEADGVDFIVMELVSGQSLERLIHGKDYRSSVSSSSDCRSRRRSMPRTPSAWCTGKSSRRTSW